ncbi:hypothetical protein ACWEDZ_02050 [Streptomyces sp. NPDC005047]
MSYATPRSMTGDLNDGLTDGTYKKVSTDRGGGVDPATYGVRQDLNDLWYGVHEAAVKRRPEGLAVRTPTYVPTPPAHLYTGM